MVARLNPTTNATATAVAAAKAYLVTFTQALAGELSGTGVKVQVCLPGMVQTEFHTVQGFDTSHDGFMSVGAHRLTGEPAALMPGQRLFTFVART